MPSGSNAQLGHLLAQGIYPVAVLAFQPDPDGVVVRLGGQVLTSSLAPP